MNHSAIPRRFTQFSLHTPFAEAELDSLFAEALGEFYITDSMAEQIRQRLKESHEDSVAFEKKELKRLQTRYTQRKNHPDLICEDRLSGVITVDQYNLKQAEIQNELKDIEMQIAKLGKYNVRYKEEGKTILELLNGFKTNYLGQDMQGKANILSVLLDRCKIMGEKSTNHTGSRLEKRATEFVWKSPFDSPFRMGQIAREYGQVRKKEIRGGRIYEFRTFLRHHSIADQIQALQAVVQPLSPARPPLS